MGSRTRPRRVRDSGWRQALVAIAVFAAASCGGGVVGPSNVLAPATWGGDHVTMTVTSASTHFEFDCAHGDLTGSFTLDSSGAFNLAGTYVREHGGPVVIGVPPDSHPALYAGQVNGDSMSLTVTLTDSSTAVGTFTLTRGGPGRVVKCL